MFAEHYEKIKPFLRLVLQLLGYSIVTIIVMAVLYQDKIQQYLDENWNAIRCEPYVIPFAGFSTVADGETYGEKVNKNFQHCTGTHIKTAFPSLFEPFIAFLAIIKSSLAQVSGSINTFRKALTTIRIMFAALVKNTVEKLANSYAVSIFLQEKMKNIVKRQAAVVEVMRQFLVAFPFMMESLMYGPIPRFATWLSRYMGMLISSIIICLLCTFGGPFVSMFACPMCAICFTPSSIVGSGSYRKQIQHCDIGNYLDKSTYITGIIYFGSTSIATETGTVVEHLQTLYPLHHPDDQGRYGKPITYINPSDAFTPAVSASSATHTWVTGSHAIFDSDRNVWTRVAEWANHRKIKPAIAYEPLVCLVTSNHTIPVGDHTCKDYEETGNTSVLHALSFQRQCVRNNIDATDEEIVEYTARMTANHRGIYSGMTYEEFVRWATQYDKEYKFPAHPCVTAIRRFFYQYEPSKKEHGYLNKHFRESIRGFRIDRGGDIVWYRYRGHVVAENTLVQTQTCDQPTGLTQWRRVADCHDAVRLNPVYQNFSIEPTWVIHVYTADSNVCLVDGSSSVLTIADAMEVRDSNWVKGELEILTNVSNCEQGDHHELGK